MRMDRERPIAQTVRPIRAALVAGTGFPVCPNCEGGSPFPGEDSAAAAAGTFAVSTAGDKKGRHLRFLPPLNTRFPCWDSLGADGRLRKQEKGNGSRVTTACLSPPFRSSQIAYCYTCGLINAGRGIAVPRKSLARCNARHLRI